MDELVAYDFQAKPRTAARRYWAHANHLYSVAAMTSSVGAVVERYRYDAYGKRTVTNAAGTPIAASAIGQQTGFTGRFHDAETGLIYFRARYMSPNLGRFIARDPWRRRHLTPSAGDGYPDGLLLYGGYFVPNRLDPKGTNAHSECLAKIEKFKNANKDILDKMKAANCPEPKFDCKCCDYSGYYDTATNTIWICENSTSNNATTIRHELVHALDKCQKADFNDCKQWACSEVRANSLSGDCEQGGDFFAVGQSRDDCIKKYAAMSLDIVPESKCKPGMPYVEAVFQQCACAAGTTPPPDFPKLQ